MRSKQKMRLRQQLYIDSQVQGSLLRRAVLYSLACIVYFQVIVVFHETMSDPSESVSSAIHRCLEESIFWAPGFVLLSPVLAYDLLRVTNRFAGPMFRLRREMQRLAAGKSESPLSFREGDYWVEVAETFNQIREELQQLRQEKARIVASADPGAPEASVQAKLFVDDETESAGRLRIGNAS